MANNRDDIETLRTRFLAMWPSAVPVIFDNDANRPEPTAIWARLSIQPGSSSYASIGRRTYLQLGRVYLQIFVPAQLGSLPGIDLADVFATIFRNWTSADYRLRCGTPSIDVSDDEDGYFTINCTIQYKSTH